MQHQKDIKEILASAQNALLANELEFAQPLILYLFIFNIISKEFECVRGYFGYLPTH